MKLLGFPVSMGILLLHAFVTMRMIPLSASKSSLSKLGTMLFQTFSVICTLPLVVSKCSFSDLPHNVKEKIRQQPVMPYDIPPNHDPVQGLHLAMDGRDRLRVTWMIPMSPGTTNLAPVCFYWSQTSDRHQQTQSGGPEEASSGKDRILHPNKEIPVTSTGDNETHSNGFEEDGVFNRTQNEERHVLSIGENESLVNIFPPINSDEKNRSQVPDLLPKHEKQINESQRNNLTLVPTPLLNVEDEINERQHTSTNDYKRSDTQAPLSTPTSYTDITERQTQTWTPAGDNRGNRGQEYNNDTSTHVSDSLTTSSIERNDKSTTPIEKKQHETQVSAFTPTPSKENNTQMPRATSLLTSINKKLDFVLKSMIELAQSWRVLTLNAVWNCDMCGQKLGTRIPLPSITPALPKGYNDSLDGGPFLASSAETDNNNYASKYFTSRPRPSDRSFPVSQSRTFKLSPLQHHASNVVSRKRHGISTLVINRQPASELTSSKHRSSTFFPKQDHNFSGAAPRQHRASNFVPRHQVARLSSNVYRRPTYKLFSRQRPIPELASRHHQVSSNRNYASDYQQSSSAVPARHYFAAQPAFGYPQNSDSHEARDDSYRWRDIYRNDGVLRTDRSNGNHHASRAVDKTVSVQSNINHEYKTKTQHLGKRYFSGQRLGSNINLHPQARAHLPRRVVQSQSIYKHHDSIKKHQINKPLNQNGHNHASTASRQMKQSGPWNTPKKRVKRSRRSTSNPGEMTNFAYEAKGQVYTYKEGGFSQTLNFAILDLSIIPCLFRSGSCVKSFSYQCGDASWGFSQAQQVTIHSENVPSTPQSQIAIVGDLSIPQSQKTIDSITARIRNSSFQRSDAAGSDRSDVGMLLHLGDISYADNYNKETGNNSYRWVDYMNSMQSVAARVPYMTAPGNHERQFNFSAYRNWLPMPYHASQSTSPYWFSFDHLGVHVLSFSTEHDFSHHSEQRTWIKENLKKANKNREHVPWVILIGHRPLYCTSVMCKSRCHHEARKYRHRLEKLLYDERVDVVLTGNNHQYERSYPVYNSQATQYNYSSPTAPVYIVNGAGGNPEYLDPTFQHRVAWRAWYDPSMTTGFLLMTPSPTQLTFDYVSSDTNDVIDSFTIFK